MAIKPIYKYVLHAAITLFLFYILQKNEINKVAYLSKLYSCTSFYKPILNDACVS